MSVARQVARCRRLVLVALAACAPTATPSGRVTSPPRPAIGAGQPGPRGAVPPSAPDPASVPRPPPPVVDAEQRAILDALEEVAKVLETPRELADLAAAVGTPIATDRQHGWLEVTPRAAALSRVRIELGRRPTENRLEVTVRTPTNAAILGARFGALAEEGFLREFGDAYWLTRCRPLSDGASISIDVWLDGTIEPLEAEPTSVVFIERWAPHPYRICSP